MVVPLGGTGRAVERGRLEVAAARARAGHGGLTVVVGEPGIGKTHLLETLVASVASRMTVASATATAWPGTEPYGIWAQILPELAPRATSDTGAAGHWETIDAAWRGVLDRLLTSTDGRHDTVGGSDLARLQLFDDVRSLLRAAATDRPTLLVIDDLQLVPASALDLLSFLVPSLASMPLAVVAATRPTPTGSDGTPPDPVAPLVRMGDAIRLSVLSPDDTASLIAAHGGPAAGTTLSDEIRRRSGGNPLFAVELTRLANDRGTAGPHSAFDDHGVPATVMAAVAERGRSLSSDARTVLDVAAVLGEEFRERDLRAVLAQDDASPAVDAALAELARVALIESTRLGFRFTHGVLREAVHDGIPTDRRRRLHGAVVEAIATTEPGSSLPPAELAAHLLASDLPDRVDRAAEALAAAARSELAVHAYAEALRHIDQAIDLAGDGGARGAAMLVDRGSVLQALGDTVAAKEAFRRAAERARSDAEPVILARAALGVGSGETGFEVPLLDVEQIDLLREAIDALPASATTWRARLLARLSVALTSTEEGARRALCAEAVQDARSSGDPATIAAALAAQCDALAGPDHSAERERWSSEVVELARRCSDPGLQLLGLRLRLVARLEQGDVVGALGDSDDFSAIADRLGQPVFRWYPHLWRAMRLLLDGQSDAAFEAAARAEEEGRRANSGNAEVLVMTHRWMHWVHIADVESLRGLLVQFQDGDAMPRATWAWVALAYAFAHVGRLNAARLRLDAVADDLTAAPRDSEWLPMLSQVAEAVHLCDGHPLATWTYDALLPYRNRFVVEGIGAVMAGSVERPLGLLAAAKGDATAAVEHFDAAIDAHHRIGSTALVARTHFEAGVALDDADHLALARGLYDELGWDRCVERVERRLERRPARRDASASDPVGRLVRDGDGWELSFRGTTVHLKDSKGLHDLVELVRRPHIEIAALDLLDAGDGNVGDRRSGGDTSGLGGPEGDLGPVIDARARAQYRARIEVLDAEIEDASAIGNAKRLESAQNERDALVAELTSAYGLGGRPRRTGDRAERARTTVTSRIRYAIERIEEVHPELGRHLRNSIVTGRFCTYRPESPALWEL